jgi:hypothetical protein
VTCVSPDKVFPNPRTLITQVGLIFADFSYTYPRKSARSAFTLATALAAQVSAFYSKTAQIMRLIGLRFNYG